MLVLPPEAGVQVQSSVRVRDGAGGRRRWRADTAYRPIGVRPGRTGIWPVDCPTLAALFADRLSGMCKGGATTLRCAHGQMRLRQAPWWGGSHSRNLHTFRPLCRST